MTTPTEVPVPPELMKWLSRSVQDVNFYQAGISEYQSAKAENGNTVIKGLNVFRSGTFKDSMGEQHTWPDEQIAQMASQFATLRDNGILPNVPVREGHKSFFGGGGAVKGYITSLQAKKGTLPDGSETTFLKADFELTEPDAAEKLARGTYRARSAEVGMYESNDGALYFPTFMGFAFVDIPAVEGLYSRADGTPFLLVCEENSVTDAPAAPPVPPGTQTETPPVVPTVTEHNTPAPVMEFTINGQKVTDYAAVQAHIATLEGFKDEAVKAGRKSFAKAMADSNRILASDLEKFEKKVLEMDPTSFETLQTAMEFAQPHRVVGQQMAGGATNLDGETGNHSASPIDDEISVQEGIIEGLRHAAMSDEAIKKTGAYQKLQDLKARKSTMQTA